MYEEFGAWFKTTKKAYSVWLCRPLPGTVVTNKLENSRQATDIDNCFVICGTVGEKWVIGRKKLEKTYMLPTGAMINEEKLLGKYSWINDNNGKHRPVMDWVRICTKVGDIKPVYYAKSLPGSVKRLSIRTVAGTVLTANRPGIDHGDGDYLVCPDKDGRPDTDDVWVVNGLVFPRTYILPQDAGKSGMADTPQITQVMMPESIFMPNGEIASVIS